MKARSLKPARIVRWCILAASAAFFLFFSKFITEHAICPIGGFESFFNGLFATGFSLAGLFSGMILVFLVMSILSIVFRRAYCSYICPLGALQELFERVGKLVLPRKMRGLRIPAPIDRALRWVKYLVLASFVALAAIAGGHWMIPGDPYLVLLSLGKGGVFSTIQRLPYASAFFAAILLFAFFLGRGFCKYLCPAGAWYGILSKISPNKVRRNEELCIGCGQCTKACPMNIDVERVKKVTSAECIGCRECVNACPKKGALSAPVGSVNVPASLVPVVAAAVFAGSVYLAKSSMPARPEGQRAPGGEGGQGPGIQKGDPSQGEAKKVGFGGCPNCNGCGLCGPILKA